MTVEPPIENLAFGRFLKFWRNLHHLSQEELAFRHDCSPRHISRLENGFSRPSEIFIEELAEVLNLGERDRNHLRLSAGYSPKQDKIDFNAPQMKWLRNAMRLSLRSMDPYPATLADSCGKILMVNKGWVAFYQKILPGTDLDKIDNAYDFIFSRSGSGPIFSDWDNTRSLILMAIKQETILTENEDQIELLERLSKQPGVPHDWQERAAKIEPMASFKLQINFNNALNKFYYINKTVGAMGPTAYVSEPKLTISTLYPEDETIDLSLLLDHPVSHPLLFY